MWHRHGSSSFVGAGIASFLAVQGTRPLGSVSVSPRRRAGIHPSALLLFVQKAFLSGMLSHRSDLEEMSLSG